jgi:protein-tyrosine phosphatase
MYTDIFWIETPGVGKIGIMARPRGGDWLEDEISYFRQGGVNSIVSLLTCSEVRELQLSEEQLLCKQYGMVFYSVPVEDRCVPESEKEVLDVLYRVLELLHRGCNIAIHCRQGIGRSGLFAASVLTSLGVSVTEAFSRIEYFRGREVPDTKEQIEWVANFADKYCSRKGVFQKKW